MSRQFDEMFVNGDLTDADHIKQLISPLEDLESGQALFREANVNGSNFEVDFQAAANADGYYLNSIAQGQMIIFKALAASPASAQLSVSMETGGPIAAPLHLADVQVGANDIKQNQIVVAIYNNTSTPRFDVVGLGGSGSGGGGASDLDDLTDVTFPTAPTTGEILQRKAGGQFENTSLAAAGISETGHTHPVTDITGTLLVSQGGTGATTAVAALSNLGGQTQDSSLDEISTLTLSKGDILVHDGTEIKNLGVAGATNGDVLKVDSGASEGVSWGAVSGGGGASTLNDLTDVTLSPPSSGELLQHDGTDFVNRSPSAAGVVETSRSVGTSAPLTGGGDLTADRTISIPAASASQDGYLSSTDWADFDGKQDALTGTSDVPGLDTALTGKQAKSEKGQANGYAELDGTGKVPASQLPAGGGGGASDLDGLSDVTVSSPVSGQVFQHDGAGQFVNRDLASAGIAAASHTHTIGDVTSLQTNLDAKQASSEKGQASGYAELDATGKVPSSQLPSSSGGTIGVSEVAFGGTGGVITSDSNLTYDGSTLIYSGTNSARLEGSGYYSVALGGSSVSSGGSSVAVGVSTDATNTGSIAIGNAAQSTGTQSVALGQSSNASGGDSSIAVGLGANAATGGGIAIGSGSATSVSGFGIAIGKSASAEAANVITMGQGSSTLAQDAIAIGRTASAASSYSIALGLRASATGGNAVAIGADSSAAAISAVALGVYADASATYGIAIGSGVTSTASAGVAIGYGSDTFGSYGLSLCRGQCNHDYSMAVGYGADTTDNHQLVLGGTTGALLETYLGRGVQKTGSVRYTSTLQASGGDGTDIKGDTMRLAGGKGTGSATGGSVVLATAPSSTTGTNLNTLVDRFTIDGEGRMGFFGATPADQSAGWSVSNVTTTKSYDASTATLDETRQALATLVDYLKNLGILGA